jgi:hypothetical protein
MEDTLVPHRLEPGVVQSREPAVGSEAEWAYKKIQFICPFENFLSDIAHQFFQI